MSYYEFDPLTDEQLEAMDVVEEGHYRFEVQKSTRKVSKNGNPICELQIKFWDKDGNVHVVFDYLVFSKVNLNIKKVSHFCKAAGLEEQYKKGQLPEDLQYCCGVAHVGIREEQKSPDGKVYPKKNIVVDYDVMAKGTAAGGMKPLPEVKDEFIDDVIPF
jgi:hypothetical protein